MSKELDRRTFLKGSLFASAAIGGGGILAACTSGGTGSGTASGGASAPATGNQTTTGYSWEQAPVPITDIASTVETEVLVIGAGCSGLSTACAAAENGAKVVVVEKSDTLSLLAPSLGAAKSKVMDAEGVVIDKVYAQGQWNRTCANRADETLVNVFFEKSEGAINWILEKNEKYGGMAVLNASHGVNSDIYPEGRTQHFIMVPEEVGERGINSLLYKESMDFGAEYIFNSPAVQLIMDGGRVAGCICEGESGYVEYKASKAVVLATGDISNNLDMVKAYCPLVAPLIADGAIIYPTKNDTGDGHAMGLQAGAVMQDLPLPPMIHPEIYCKFSPGSSLAVNKNGKRFFNEGCWMQGRSLNIMRQPDYVAYWLIDKNWHEGYIKGLEAGGGIWWDGFSDEAAAMEQLDGYVKEGLAWRADTLEDLAAQVGLPTGEFMTTIEQYNDLCAKGEDTDYHKDPILMTPLKDGPFYAMQVGASVLVIVGGLLVDTNSQCLNADKDPIPGLFAVGNVQGGLFANDYPLYVAGCSGGRCVTFGYELGKYLANLA
jgi:succinate dehydrogenase/fumarate reductase flavoprotein subunit